jgi:SepF-like predicted cell division protein (DUF552 family)
LADIAPVEETRRQLARLREQIRQTAEAMPTHEKFIADTCRAELAKPRQSAQP